MAYRFLTRVAGAALARLAPLGGADLRQRLGRAGASAPRGGVWLHGASVGEVASARVLIEALAAEMPLVVTTNTATGRDAAARMGVAAMLAPLDTPQALAAFLDRHQPAVAVTVENEMWPNRADALASRGTPQVVIGARLSARSARRWRLAPGLARRVLGGIDALSAQDPDSEARLLELGLRRSALLPRVNLKRLGPARAEAPPPGPARGITVLAASTHEGEEGAILDALAAARTTLPALRIIVAPRHPKRFAAAAAAMASRGMMPARRSEGGDAAAPVLLANSLGEMPLWYAAAGIVVTGGSFAPLGGHTPWEPAAQRCAILHGPHVANFAEDYAQLDAAGGARLVTAGELAPAILALARDHSTAEAMGGRAREVLLASAGDPAPLLQAIRDFAFR